MPDGPLLAAFDARDGAAVTAAMSRLGAALMAKAPVERGPITVPPHPDLIGVPDRLYRQIEVLLETKRHLIFYGPPGTGKTTLAEHVAEQLSPGRYHVATGSSDWASQDVIGGYQPVGAELKFVEGFLLENFDRPVVIDELNRTDIDRALGPLFTVLSGHSVTLPYLVDLEAPEKGRHEIQAKGERSDRVHVPTDDWRLLATLNTLDKASLYQMSYALSRRFGWVLVDAPDDTEGFLREYLGGAELAAGDAALPRVPLGVVWHEVNGVRRIGPAPYLDVVRYCRKRVEGAVFAGDPTAEAAEAMVEGLTASVVPMLDGITRAEGDAVLDAVAAALLLADDGRPRRDLAQALDEVAA